KILALQSRVPEPFWQFVSYRPVGSAIPFQQVIFLRSKLFFQVLDCINQKSRCARCRIDQALTCFWLSKLDQETDDMARGAELSIFTGGINLTEQVLKNIAHQIAGACVTDIIEKIIDHLNSILKERRFVFRELEKSILHWSIQYARSIGAVAEAIERIMQHAQPGKNVAIHMVIGCNFASGFGIICCRKPAQIGPAAGAMPLTFLIIRRISVWRQRLIDANFVLRVMIKL